MGKIILEKKNTKKKKKKGRPSLLDLQKRTLKQQHRLFNFHKKNKKPPFSNPNPNPNPNSKSTVVAAVDGGDDGGRRRSTRRNPNPNSDEDVCKGGGKKRREKKLNLISLGKEENVEGEGEGEGGEVEVPGSNLRKRKIDGISGGSGGGGGNVKGLIKGEKHSADATKQTSTTQQGGGSNLNDDGPSTSLPDKSLLVFILDRLQKKDTYGVFSEPVDPEELPDYHEVIEHPMDFGTVRSKLDKDAYASLEEFEKDIFLICSNAMQYNAPDTVYFRQARSIQELAKKNFDNLRADSDDNNNPGQEIEPEPKVVRRGRPPTKNLKKPLGRPPLERATSNFSDDTISHTGSNANRSNNEIRKSSYSEKYGSSDSLARSLYGTRYGEAYFGLSAERYERADDLTGSASKGYPMKFGKKHMLLDESRRNTYMHSCALASGQDSSVLSTFNRERKQLIAVGLHTEYGYARSLARFAAKVGPVAWKVASKKIERCLPVGVKFGPGWIGENEAPAERPIQQESPVSAGQQTPSSLPVRTNSASSPGGGPRDADCDGSSQKPQGNQLPENQKPCNNVKVKEESGDGTSPAVGNDATPVCSSTLPSDGAGPNLTAPEASASSSSSTQVNVNDGTGSLRRCQTSVVQSRINGLNGSYGPNLVAQMGKIIGGVRPTMFNLQTNLSNGTAPKSETHSPRPSAPTDNKSCGQAKLGDSKVKSIDCLPKTESSQNGVPTPPDLNVGFQSPGSPVSGKGESVQPDLALQL